MVKMEAPTLNNGDQRPIEVNPILSWDYFTERRNELMWENLCATYGGFNANSINIYKIEGHITLPVLSTVVGSVFLSLFCC